MSNSHMLPPVVPASELGMMVPSSRTALLVVDVQEDFASPSGAMARAGLDLSEIESAIDRMEALIAAARSAGVAVVFVRVVTREETDSKALKQLWARKGRPGGHAICRAKESGSGYYRVKPEPGDAEIEKTLFSSFSGTDLDQMLRRRGVDTIVVCGLTTDCCVDCTIRDAFHRDYHCFVVGDACAAYDRTLHAAALKALARNCALLTATNDVVTVWSAPQP